MGAILARFFEHNTWANLRLLDAQLEASSPGTFGGVGATLGHLAFNQARYLAVLTDAEPPPRPWAPGEFPGVAALREHLRRSGEALVAVAAREPEGRILGGVLDGEPYANPASTVLIQAINHATEHRAHVATILSQIGIEPPEMDGWAYGEEMDPAPAGP